ncbi:hypothetical protein TNCV_1786991 [Trichonephila clavipes]|nr:hypothetical protein TNCV_1786991 [Trichonephila clavipes]
MIFKALKHLDIRKVFLYGIITRFLKNSFPDRTRSDRPYLVRTPAIVKALKVKLFTILFDGRLFLLNRQTCQKRTMCRIENEELRPRGYRKITGYFLAKELRRQVATLKQKQYCHGVLVTITNEVC